MIESEAKTVEPKDEPVKSYTKPLEPAARANWLNKRMNQPNQMQGRHELAEKRLKKTKLVEKRLNLLFSEGSG